MGYLPGPPGPGSLANGLGVAHYIGVLLVMILGASVIGTEYGWGTLRTALTRGTERWQFLGAKALSLVLLSAAGLIVVLLTVVVSSLIAGESRQRSRSRPLHRCSPRHDPWSVGDWHRVRAGAPYGQH